MFFDTVSYSIFWLALAVILGIIEVITLGLATIWFAAGAIIAFLLSLVGVPFWVQLLVFFVASAALLVFTRPIATKYLKIGGARTNADRFIGEEGIVLVKIDPINGTGLVKVMGQTWSAKTADGSEIEKGERINVSEIVGVKLVVQKIA